MKKILLATTLLAATAGVAAADVAVSGSARMGIVYDGSDAQFSSRVRIVFDGSGTTDGGLSFGASMRADQQGGNNNDAGAVKNGTANGDSTVFLSGAFGKITMGDVAGGASDNLVGQVSGVGYTGIGDLNEIGFLGGAATAARYDYSNGPLSVSLGVGQTTAGDDAMSIAGAYDAGNYSVALGYSDTKTDSQIDLKGTAKFGAITAKLRVASLDSAADPAFAASVDYSTGALTLTAFATKNVDFADTDTVGLGAAYDLGGGATVLGGVVDDGTDTFADVGVKFSF